ncbi:DUF192 domain-containing protein [bacterium]|nr:DUF192 domain-containing protein [bacterium]
MLVKVHNSRSYLEDFGLVDGSTLHLIENGPVKLAKVTVSPVVRVNALWVSKHIKVRCQNIADTYSKKVKGLSDFDKLGSNEGMYFPYKDCGKVSIHQSGVKFPLDILFLREGNIVKIEENTKVGSADVWTCDHCTGVIEVPGGFCKENDVAIYDRIALCSVSKQDILEVEEQLPFDGSEEDVTSLSPFSLVSRIADSL